MNKIFYRRLGLGLRIYIINYFLFFLNYNGNIYKVNHRINLLEEASMTMLKQ